MRLASMAPGLKAGIPQTCRDPRNLNFNALYCIDMYRLGLSSFGSGAHDQNTPAVEASGSGRIGLASFRPSESLNPKPHPACLMVFPPEWPGFHKDADGREGPFGSGHFGALF